VESSFGHVRDLPKSKMGIDIEGGTFEPTYTTNRDKTAQVKKLKDLAKKVDDIIFATDEDREGEAISWHLAHILGVKPEKAKRIAFHEITKSAIEEALAHPRTIDQNLVNAQQARRVLDRLVGYELSPFLWKKVARGLSAGRVQSVAVRLCVDREREIEAFQSKEYWSVTGFFQDSAWKSEMVDHMIEAQMYAIGEKKLNKLSIKSKEQVDGLLTDLHDASYTISAIEEREAKRTPPPPFTTSTLQQTANNKCGYSSKQTMVIAQQLYEGMEIGEHGRTGLITYMRTDSLNLSTKFLDEAKSFVAQTFGSTHSLAEPRVYKNKSKGAQEAHEAIRPTDPARTPESIKQYLDPKQYKIYELIWKRAIATQMADAKLKKAHIDITGKEYTFRATGQSLVFPGWLSLYPDAIKEEMLPDVKQGDALTCKELKPEQHFTQPPARYSDATLVKVMEEYGIGRPSTYAPTIATIEARHYVERDDDKRLKPTSIAMAVTDLLVEHFTQISDYAFTAQMENNLDEIAEGKKDWQPIIATFYHPFHELLKQKTDEVQREDILSVREIGIDPKSGKPVYSRIGTYGPFVQLGSKDDEEKPTFAQLGKNQTIDSVTLEEALKLLSLPKILGTDEDGHDIKVNIGRFGPYLQVEKTYYTLKEDDPYSISFARAKEVIQEANEKKAKEIIKSFPGSEVIVKDGRYGPYITDGKKNAKIPKDTDPATLTQEVCERLIADAPERKRRFSARRKLKS